MAERVSAAQRVEISNVAETHIMKHKGDHAMWHKYVHNVELDAVQVLKMKEMDIHPNTIDFSCRRTGKTAVKELYNLEDNATNPDQELGIVAPRMAQSIKNMTYHIEAIRRSPILSAYVSYKNGRRQMSDSKYEFCNRSKAEAYGIMAQVDGGDMTTGSLEEVDDMPKDRLYSRFLLMMGSTRKMGASKESKNDPRINITGVFKGADTLTDLLNGSSYFAIGCLHGSRARAEIAKLVQTGWVNPDSVDVEKYAYPVPILNAANAISLGLVNESAMTTIRTDLSEDETSRQLACVNTASRNLVWEIYLRFALQVGFEAKIDIVEPVPGEKYKKRGLISLGYDHSGHGETPESSKYAVVINEQIGSFTCTIFCKTWPPGTDETIVKNDLISIWRYFMPDYAMGDAFGIGLITQMNEELFQEGLINIDRRAVGDGESTASTWGEWAFSPIRFEGMVKHQMATAVRNAFHNKQAAMPYVDDYERNDQAIQDMRLLCKQMINIRAAVSKASYSIYKMADSKIGDDLFDAYMAALWAMVTRGILTVSSIVIPSSRTRQELLNPQRPRHA
ncbi:MAG: hypothetical protein OQK32_03430 [Gammaproteobacteria bacterium]|nr:hypothetical protein [Gammaproteobacteria bacterium]MCW8924506.1 hypothetical protein [Gammaproteobacteria bacterium]